MALLGLFTNLFQGADGIILLLIVLLLFGAKRLPELARGLGSAIREFSNAKNEVTRQLNAPPAEPAPPTAPGQPAAAVAPAQPPTPGAAATPQRDPLAPATTVPVSADPTAAYEDPYAPRS